MRTYLLVSLAIIAGWWLRGHAHRAPRRDDW
jgi:hypothetical protein